MSVFRELTRRLRGRPDWIRDHVFVTTENGKLDPSSNPLDQRSLREVEPQDALMVSALRSSVTGHERYALLLDLDHGATFYPSTTRGHGHLLIDAWLTKDQHDRVLDILAEVGVIEHGFARSGKASRFGSTLRLPWVVKGQDKTLTELLARPARVSDAWPPVPLDAMPFN